MILARRASKRKLGVITTHNLREGELRELHNSESVFKSALVYQTGLGHTSQKRHFGGKLAS